VEFQCFRVSLQRSVDRQQQGSFFAERFNDFINGTKQGNCRNRCFRDWLFVDWQDASDLLEVRGLQLIKVNSICRSALDREIASISSMKVFISFLILSY
jgi:hypothetical protein